jgi:hypothetical protein
MADAKLQHYVPRLLLRKFAFGKKDYVHVHDMELRRRKCRSCRDESNAKQLSDEKLQAEPIVSALWFVAEVSHL